MEVQLKICLAAGILVLIGLAVILLIFRRRTAYLGPVREELKKEKAWLRRGEYNAAMVKGRQNLELLLKLVAENNEIQLDNTALAVANAMAQDGKSRPNGKASNVMTHQQFNRWLSENGYLDRVARWEMNQVRIIGNKAVHENYGDKDDAQNQYDYLEDILKTITEMSQSHVKRQEKVREFSEAKKKNKNVHNKNRRRNNQERKKQQKETKQVKPQQEAKKQQQAKPQQETKKTQQAKPQQETKKTQQAKPQQETRKIQQAKQQQETRKTQQVKTQQETKKTQQAKQQQETRKAQQAKTQQETKTPQVKPPQTKVPQAKSTKKSEKSQQVKSQQEPKKIPQEINSQETKKVQAVQAASEKNNEPKTAGESKKNSGNYRRRRRRRPSGQKKEVQTERQE